MWLSTNEYVGGKNKCIRPDGTTYWRNMYDNRECEPPTEEEYLQDKKDMLDEMLSDETEYLQETRRSLATRIKKDPTEKDVEECLHDYPDLVREYDNALILAKEMEEDRDAQKEKVKKGVECILKVKESMESMMMNMMKGQMELMKDVEEFHEKAKETALKLLQAEMTLTLLRVENSELKKRLRATDPEWAEGAEEEAEEGGEDYEPDYEWLSELERNR